MYSTELQFKQVVHVPHFGKETTDSLQKGGYKEDGEL